MSHELSQTNEYDGKYRNIDKYGRPLRPLFGFEREEYPSEEQAVNAAQWRSKGHGQITRRPQPEFSGEYVKGEGSRSFFDRILDALNDPRIAAFLAPRMDFGLNERRKVIEGNKPELSVADRLLQESPTIPSLEASKKINASNARYDLYRSPTESTRFTPHNLNVFGFTRPTGEYKGRSVISTSDPETVPNTTSHELFHQRRILPTIVPTVSPIDVSLAAKFTAAMRNVEPLVKGGWGTEWGRSVEEALATLAGYEGSLPKGTSLSETTVGQALFKNNQDIKDYYFHHVSQPYGGLWEGQGKKTGYTGR